MPEEQNFSLAQSFILTVFSMHWLEYLFILVALKIPSPIFLIQRYSAVDSTNYQCVESHVYVFLTAGHSTA